MFKQIKNFIKKVGYIPDENAGKLSGSPGGNIDDKELETGGSGYNPNAEVLNQNPDGGQNTDLDASTPQKDIQDFHNQATQELLGNPQVARPTSKNNFQNVDAELQEKFFSNMETR